MYRKERGCASPTGPVDILVTGTPLRTNCCGFLFQGLLSLVYLDMGEKNDNSYRTDLPAMPGVYPK